MVYLKMRFRNVLNYISLSNVISTMKDFMKFVRLLRLLWARTGYKAFLVKFYRV